MVADPEIMSGEPCFAGTRVPVRALLDYIEGGDTLNVFLDDPDGFGIGHVPLLEAGFLEEKPVLITTTIVTPEELEGYRIWKESGGGAL